VAGASLALMGKGKAPSFLARLRGQLAQQLETDDEDSRSQALAELEAAYLQQQAKRLTELSRSDAMGVGAAFASAAS
jgi:hypothetical protein